MVLSSGRLKSTFDLRIGLVKLKCFKEYNTNNYRFDCGFVLKCFSNSPIFSYAELLLQNV